ncbi:uncharacterized protein LOC134290671 [Aedes albopictus]|uniref:Endonuclease/exonuclease/phosphatase domain-containing protein n=1 Tax=Aedes albopictus TaxID=7160 RepID=A0ABM1YGH3_AEDAL
MRLEYLVVRAEINELKVGVGVIYNPSGANQLFAQQYEKLLIDLLEFDLDQTYLIGDYNINVASSTPSTNILALNRIHATFDLTVLPTPPTRITETSCTTIDLIVTDHPATIQCSKTATGNTISDHEVIYFVSRLLIHKPPPKRIKVRNFRRVDPQALQIDFQASNLQQIYEAEDVDTKADLLTTTLQSLMQQHAPERTIQVRDQRTPWITAEIEREISTRDIAFALYNRNPNRARGDAQWCDYVRKRDRLKTLIFVAKKRYAEQNFSHQLPAKQLWSNLRRDGIHNNVKKVLPEEAADPNALNRFFTGGHLQLTNQVIPTNQTSSRQEPLPTEHANPRPNTFGFRHTTVQEVATMIFEIQTCATGSDGIPITLIKLLSPTVLPVLVHIFNAIIDAQRFPSGWKKAVVTPIPKKSCPVAREDLAASSFGVPEWSRTPANCCKSVWVQKRIQYQYCIG